MPVKVKKGDIIYQRNDLGTVLYIVQSGEVQLTDNVGCTSIKKRSGVFGTMADKRDHNTHLTPVTNSKQTKHRRQMTSIDENSSIGSPNYPIKSKALWHKLR